MSIIRNSNYVEIKKDEILLFIFRHVGSKYSWQYLGFTFSSRILPLSYQDLESTSSSLKPRQAFVSEQLLKSRLWKGHNFYLVLSLSQGISLAFWRQPPFCGEIVMSETMKGLKFHLPVSKWFRLSQYVCMYVCTYVRMYTDIYIHTSMIQWILSDTHTGTDRKHEASGLGMKTLKQKQQPEQHLASQPWFYPRSHAAGGHSNVQRVAAYAVGCIIG